MRRRCVAAITAAALPLCAGAQEPSADFPRYCQALRLYADGRIELAVATVHAWPVGELRGLMQQTVRCTGVGSTAAHAVLLATEVAIAHRQGPVQRVADYLGLAAGALGGVQPANLGAVDPGVVRSFQEDWFVVASRLLLAWTDPIAATTVIDRGLSAFKDSSRLRTLSGMATEMRAHLSNPNLHDRRVIDNMARDPQRTSLVIAENEYQHALKADETNTEARVHLGRVLFLRKEMTAARELFAVVTKDSSQPARWRYLAQLFAGAIDEFDHDWASAGQHYRAACSLLPMQQTPYIALSFAERAAGRERQAREVMAEWADLPSTDEDDPWSGYQNGAFDQEALAALRGRSATIATKVTARIMI